MVEKGQEEDGRNRVRRIRRACASLEINRRIPDREKEEKEIEVNDVQRKQEEEEEKKMRVRSKSTAPNPAPISVGEKNGCVGGCYLLLILGGIFCPTQ